MLATRASPLGAMLMLAPAGGAYAVLLWELFQLPSSDPQSSAFASALIFLFGLALWIVLAIMVVIGAVWGWMSPTAVLAAIVLLPVSAVGAFEAADLYDRHGGWPILVPMLLPPLIALYALSAFLPSFGTKPPPHFASLALGILIGSLTVLAIVARNLASP